MKTLTGLLLALFIAEPEAPLSPQAQALLAPIHDAYVRVEATQARSPPPASDRERLERLYELDQAGRGARRRIDLTVLPDGDRKAAYTASWTEIKARDLAD